MSPKPKKPGASGELFPDLPLAKPLRTYPRLTVPVWTENKANFIQRYLKLFIQITKHGTYIDGFAGPQRADFQDAWSARLVLQIRPFLLRHFFLCEENAKSFEHLSKCTDDTEKPKDRTIELYHGDFNEKVDTILESRFITEKEAVFCLLDQRMFECHWSTVEKLARKKRGMKIELFYFFGFGWVKRALAGVTRHNDKIERWWGRTDYSTLRKSTREEIRDLLVKRFTDELGYKTALPYPIYRRHDNNIVMYDMIHATDHEEAPHLMNRAYRQAVRNSQKIAEQLNLLSDEFKEN